MNALRWDGRPGWYEVWYLIVAGRFWLRYTLHVPSDPQAEGEAALWLASFDGVPSARKEVFPLDAFRTSAAGWPLELGSATLADSRATGPDFDLHLRALAAPADPLPRVVRPLARTRFLLAQPVVEVSGTIDGVELDRALGTQAHVFGTRHAERFAWAHAGTRDGSYVELLTAKAKGLPVLSFREGRFARAALEPGLWRIGGYRIEAEPGDFLGVTYRDPDGTPVYCYHSERARLFWPGRGTVAAAF
ncbi:MAG: hypothetical protein ACXVZN_11470, partial [Gaiellaceae bacterium]